MYKQLFHFANHVVKRSLLHKIGENNALPVSVHQKCRRDSADKRRIRPMKESTDSSVSKCLKRLDISPLSWKESCVAKTFLIHNVLTRMMFVKHLLSRCIQESLACAEKVVTNGPLK